MYSKLYFGKEQSKLTYTDIEKFFLKEREESDKIEFKSYYNPDEKNQTEKENAIIKTICGLLNAEGGIIVWGAPIGQVIKDKKEKIFKGSLSPLLKNIEKDALINRITNLITPSPQGITVTSQEKKGNFVCVIEVAKSLYSPHQFRNIYYTRIDGQTKPAPHHYIEALMKKILFPNLEGYISLNTFQYTGERVSKLQLHFCVYIFNLTRLQNDFNVSYRLLCNYGEFQHWNAVIRDTAVGFGNHGRERIVANVKDVIRYGEPIVEYVTIEFEPTLLDKNDRVFELLLSFGAKNSPMKTSWYKIKLPLNKPSDMQGCIISMKENQFIYEVKDKLGISDKEGILNILGRKK